GLEAGVAGAGHGLLLLRELLVVRAAVAVGEDLAERPGGDRVVVRRAAVAARGEPARLVAAGAGALPHHDRRHARAHRGRPVRAPAAGGAAPEHVREDAGAEIPARVVGEKAVEAHPAAGLPV